MPSVLHETPLELIRQHPPLVLDLLRAFSGLTVEHGAEVELVSADASVVVPTQFLADSVALVKDSAGRPVLAVVIEPQGRDARTKQYSWPVYVCSARRNNECDTVLLVICWDADEAAECRETIYTGHPLFDLTPIVADPRSPLSIEGDGTASPYLVLFAGYIGAIDLDTDEGQEMVLQAARQIPETDNRKACITLIMAVASEAARQALEAKMAGTAYRNEFIESFYEKGLAEGEARGETRGRSEGRSEGWAEGLTEGLAASEARARGAWVEALFRLLEARGITLTASRTRQVTDCADKAQLQAWHLAAITAKTAEQVFGG